LISLCILIAITVLPLLVTAWILAWSARLVGSSRGRMRFGLRATILCTSVSIVFIIADALVSKDAKQMPKLPAPAVKVVLVTVAVNAIFVVLRRVFVLSRARTFAPFGAYFAIGLAQIGIAAGLVRPFLTEAFIMPTRSMSPTIEPGDRFIVNKVIRPRRWDLVAVWRNDPQPATYCERLVGLPGERLRFEHGTIYINGQATTPPSVLAGLCHARPAAIPPSQGRYRDGETIALGGDEYFLICDNVDRAFDSRMRGPSPASSLVGVVDWIYWPLSRARIVR